MHGPARAIQGGLPSCLHLPSSQSRAATSWSSGSPPVQCIAMQGNMQAPHNAGQRTMQVNHEAGLAPGILHAGTGLVRACTPVHGGLAACTQGTDARNRTAAWHQDACAAHLTISTHTSGPPGNSFSSSSLTCAAQHATARHSTVQYSTAQHSSRQPRLHGGS